MLILVCNKKTLKKKNLNLSSFTEEVGVTINNENKRILKMKNYSSGI